MGISVSVADPIFAAKEMPLPRFPKDAVLFTERVESTYKSDTGYSAEEITTRELDRMRRARAHARQVRCYVSENGHSDILIVYYLIGTSDDHFQAFLEECALEST